MPKPKLTFLSDPPIVVNTKEYQNVEIEIEPKSTDFCKVVLSVAARSVFFENGQKKLEKNVTIAPNEEKVSVELPLKMKVEEPVKYFVLLTANAFNKENEKSFTKRIEMEVDGTLTESDSDNGNEDPIT